MLTPLFVLQVHDKYQVMISSKSRSTFSSRHKSREERQSRCMGCYQQLKKNGWTFSLNGGGTMNQPVGWICWILMASLSRSLDFPSLFISLEHLLFLHIFICRPPQSRPSLLMLTCSPMDNGVLVQQKHRIANRPIWLEMSVPETGSWQILYDRHCSTQPHPQDRWTDCVQGRVRDASDRGSTI